MDSDRFTEGVSQALVDASSLCVTRKNPEVTPVHLALAMFKDKQQLPSRIISRAHCCADSIESALESSLQKLPVQDPPARPVPSGVLLKVLNKAAEIQKKQGDGFIALDVLLLALFEDSTVGKVFQSAGLTKQKAEESMAAIRGTRKVENRHAETTFEALRKYAINVVELAEAGKLDPVIGRDEEIRRVIRVLCRRTKKQPCPNWRSRCGQNGHCGRLGSTNCTRRCPSESSGSALELRHGSVNRRSFLPRRV